MTMWDTSVRYATAKTQIYLPNVDRRRAIKLIAPQSTSIAFLNIVSLYLRDLMKLTALVVSVTLGHVTGHEGEFL